MCTSALVLIGQLRSRLPRQLPGLVIRPNWRETWRRRALPRNNDGGQQHRFVADRHTTAGLASRKHSDPTSDIVSEVGLLMLREKTSAAYRCLKPDTDT